MTIGKEQLNKWMIQLYEILDSHQEEWVFKNVHNTVNLEKLIIINSR